MTKNVIFCLSYDNFKQDFRHLVKSVFQWIIQHFHRHHYNVLFTWKSFMMLSTEKPM